MKKSKYYSIVFNCESLCNTIKLFENLQEAKKAISKISRIGCFYSDELTDYQRENGTLTLYRNFEKCDSIEIETKNFTKKYIRSKKRK